MHSADDQDTDDSQDTDNDKDTDNDQDAGECHFHNIILLQSISVVNFLESGLADVGKGKEKRDSSDLDNQGWINHLVTNLLLNISVMNV